VRLLPLITQVHLTEKARLNLLLPLLHRPSDVLLHLDRGDVLDGTFVVIDAEPKGGGTLGTFYIIR
jgi:hypothetical protein